MSAKLIRRGDVWIVRALIDHKFFEASHARSWAKLNGLKLTRAKHEDLRWVRGKLI
jgi:hypothetical protein